MKEAPFNCLKAQKTARLRAASFRLRLLLAVVLGFGELLVEAIDASVGLDETLLTGVERMAIRAGIDFDFIKGRTGFEGRAASRASDFAVMVLRMDVFLHIPYSFRRTPYWCTES